MVKGKNRDVLVIGGGIAGIQAALLLAEKDHHVYMLESDSAIGGFFPLLDRTFPTNSCGVCFMSPRPPAYCPIYESEFHENIELLTNCELKSLKGQAGNFSASYIEKPRYVDMDKCTLCDKCADVCPVEVGRELGAGIEKRKAIYLPFAQAIPRSYIIDEAVCTKCGDCLKVCSPGAINLKDKPREKKLDAGAVVLGFGFEPFQGEHKGEYGFGRYKNVVSSIQYERMLSFSGPTGGLPGRPSDDKRPKKVAFIQCVGSRDPSCGQDYCSSICCMYATKQAMISKDRDKNLDAAIFYMDIRVMGKNYERYYEKARQEYGIRYLRSAVSTVRELQQSKRLLIAYGSGTGELRQEEFDMVVLSLGFTPPAGVRETAKRLGIKLNEYNFCLTDEFCPTGTSVPGIFVAGAFREPRDIPETVVEASSAAADVSQLLDDFGKKTVKGRPSEAKDAGEDENLRVGVFICDNKGVLAEGLNIEEVTLGLKEDTDIACIEKVDITRLEKAVESIKNKISENRLNRVVMAGHRGMALSKALRNRCEAVSSGFCLLEYANIGEQCANVHTGDSPAATIKARNLVRASIRKAKLAVQRMAGRKKVHSRALVVGGGISGLSSSLSFAEQGMDVTLVEKSGELGGIARSAYYTLKGSDVQALVRDMVSRVEAHAGIEVLKDSELKALEGTWGSYRSLISAGSEEKEVLHGAVIFATGGKEALPEEYLFGENENVLTQRSFERMLAGKEEKAKKVKTVVMIQCVGSRDEKRPYCSRVCCGQAIKNSLKLKELNSEVDVYVLYRDMRTYGFYEKYYHEAREKGVIFVRYEPPDKPEVSSNNSTIRVCFFDDAAGERRSVDADLLVLSSGIMPNEENLKLAEIAGLELNADGFFEEANPKAAPLDSKDRGKYFCGICHSPNYIEDVICQGKAAAARASALLWRGFEEYPENQAYVNERLCSGCGLCVSDCPYDARVIDEVNNKAKVLNDLCKGCGTCVITCPNGASQQYDFERSTMLDVLDEVLG